VRIKLLILITGRPDGAYIFGYAFSLQTDRP